MRLCAVTIFFNPNSFVVKSLSSYIHQVEIIYIIDNSTMDLNDEIKNFIESQNNIKYIHLGDNFGIAYALNLGVRRAISDKFEWILTMDQDSIVDPNLIFNYTKFIRNNRFTNLGILSPNLFLFGSKEQTLNNSFEFTVSVITSGSLTNSNAYLNVDGFDEKLFIDWVDFDICFRLKKKGFNIIKLNNTFIKHHLGETKEISIFNKHIMYITNHNAMRYYYKTRNALYLGRKFNETKLFLYKTIIMDIVKIIFFEIDKLNKLSFIIKGFTDFGSNKMGKLQ